jgi:DNA gyrase inhibitor GyrI
MFEPSIKQLDAQVVAFLAVKGPYSLIPESYGTLYGWLAHQGLQPVGMPAAVYLTAPDETPESEALWEL